MRYFLTLAYNGTPFHGWQRQPNAKSVQQTLEEALSTLLRKPITILGAGRTDTGVHAKQMMAHFDAELPLAKETNLPHLLNRYLDDNICIHQLSRVKPSAHARFDAISRTYEYHLSTLSNPFKQHLQYTVHTPLDFERMNEAAAVLLTYNDFECFSKSNTDVKTFLCEITQAIWEQKGEEARFTITANRFLRNMVRAIVGTLIEVGQHKLSVNDMHQIIASKNRGEAGFSVPACGLFLSSINYPSEIYL